MWKHFKPRDSHWKLWCKRDEYKDLAGALDWCNKGLELFPQNVPLLNMRGLLCLDQQQYTQAREIFLQLLPRALKREGTRYVILNNIAYVDALIGDPNCCRKQMHIQRKPLALFRGCHILQGHAALCS